MQPTAVVRHPQRPEIFVNVRKPTRAEQNADNRALMLARQPVAIIGPDRLPIRNDDGEVQFTYMPVPESLEVVAARLFKKIVPGVTVPDSDGQPVTLSEKTAVLLYEEHLDVDLVNSCGWCDYDRDHVVHGPEGPIPKGARRHKFDSIVPFGRYIADRIEEGKIFDSDPLASASVPQ